MTRKSTMNCHENVNYRHLRRIGGPDGMTDWGDLNIPTQAKISLEWGTRPEY